MKRILTAIAIPFSTHLLSFWILWVSNAEFKRGTDMGMCATVVLVVSVLLTGAYLDLTKKKEV